MRNTCSRISDEFVIEVGIGSIDDELDMFHRGWCSRLLLTPAVWYITSCKIITGGGKVSCVTILPMEL